MNYEQTRTFYIKEMGKTPKWCLKNIRLGYRIYTGKFANAISAMNYGKSNGNFHYGLPPKNIDVPVYINSTSKNGHVGVSVKGVFYSDGKKMGIIDNFSVIGWDEFADGVRVVSIQKDSNSFLPSKGYWAKYDKDNRIGILAEFMFKTFPAYTNKKALGNIYGDYLAKSIAEFQKRTGLYPDGMTGGKTLQVLKKYGFKY